MKKIIKALLNENNNDNIFLEFNNEYFTFKSLALALVNSNNVYIKNGKLIDIE